MPRWLASLLIFIGFMALVFLAVLPKNISVDIDINVHEEETINHNHAAPADAAAPMNEGGA